MQQQQIHSRRGFITRLGLGAAAVAASRFYQPGVFAEELARTRTAAVEEGPFYPYKLPLDTDNDLLTVNDNITPAIGNVTHLGGKLLDSGGSPIRNATIEIWSCDNLGVYYKERSSMRKGDANFQGFGRFLTGSTGEYYFRTIKPVVYPGRQAAHIHFKIKATGQRPWTTQLFVKGFPGNERDGVYQNIGNAAAKATCTMDFAPLKSSKAGELAVNFDIVMGYTATDPDEHHDNAPGHGE